MATTRLGGETWRCRFLLKHGPVPARKSLQFIHPHRGGDGLMASPSTLGKDSWLFGESDFCDLGVLSMDEKVKGESPILPPYRSAALENWYKPRRLQPLAPPRTPGRSVQVHTSPSPRHF